MRVPPPTAPDCFGRWRSPVATRPSSFCSRLLAFERMSAKFSARPPPARVIRPLLPRSLAHPPHVRACSALWIASRAAARPPTRGFHSSFACFCRNSRLVAGGGFLLHERPPKIFSSDRSLSIHSLTHSTLATTCGDPLCSCSLLSSLQDGRGPRTRPK